MKRFITPAVLFAAVFAVSLLCLPFTFIMQEYEGLFLATPDGWARAFAQPFPICGIVSDFLVQFFRDPVYGALTYAILAVAVFFELRALLRRFGIPSDALSAFLSAGLWAVTAHASGPKIAVVAVLLLAAALLLSLLVPGRAPKAWKWDVPAAAAVVCVAAAIVVLSPSVQRTERFNRVKRDALYGVWDDLLKTVPPAVAEKDPELTPFALLALSGKGELGDKMFSYPVTEENDLDMAAYDGKGEYYTSLLFKACLYQYLGCYNEAIHNYFQWATQLGKGTGFVVLRKLVELYCLQGNYVLMEKYCRILDRSLLNGAYTRHFRELAAAGQPQEPTPAGERSRIPIITHDPLYNLMLLESCGVSNRMSAERLLATLLLTGNLEQFRLAMEMIAPAWERIPLHFQEGMLAAGMDFDRIDPAVRERYTRFLLDSQRLTREELLKEYKGTAYVLPIYR